MADDNRWNDRDRDWRDDRSWWEAREDGRGGYGGDRDFGRYSADRHSNDYERSRERRYGGRGAYRRDYGERYAERGSYGAPTSYSPSGYDRGYGDEGYRSGGVGGGYDPGLDHQARHGDYDRDRPEGRRYSAYGYGADEYGYGGGSYGASNRARGRDWRAGEERSWAERAGDRISAFFGDDEAEARVRQRELARGEHRGRGPKGYRRSDDRIREDVNDRLTDDAWLDASNIDVSVSEAEVTLTGTVRNREDKRRAENLAESISGVTNVQNNLRVNAGDDEALTSAISSIPPI